MKISPRVADICSGWAEEFYDPKQPYHNWGHAEEVMEESLAFLDQGGDRTKDVDRSLLQIAAAWHDAGHDEDERFEHESPEHYSAYLMRQSLFGRLSKQQLSEIEEAILGTRYKVVRGTMSSIALHYGDVGNMAHPYASFYDHSVRLWREYGKPDWEDWKLKALGVIETTAMEALDELPIIGADGADFLRSVSMNIPRLLIEPEPKE